MCKWRILASILACLLVGGEANAGAKEDVLARMAVLYAGWNTGDADAIPFNSHTRYGVTGGLLEITDPEKMMAWAKGGFAAGLKVNIQTFHEDVNIYGDTAVFTCYERVNVDQPDREPINDSRRVTVVLVKKNGEWNGVHVHLSYLTPFNPK